MKRFSFAIRSFFSILLGGKLPVDIARAYGYSALKTTAPAPKAAPQVKASDGALQMLTILQRDARLVDFLMEDISGFEDDQVGAAVRDLHEQARAALTRHVQLVPVIDGVEGTYTKLDGPEANMVKLLGNVPASGKAAGGTLRHKGWRASRIDLPSLGGQKADVIAPAEIEVE
ncbi:MAG TPA: DUF2760 domain-containing protein [Bryobacteraceae bacterium]|nr:DUF2760 domain-containing protein [Bryobacteraceae bacterium]